MTMCCIDAEDYSNLPLGQYEEDNMLRELNKCLLAFQQKQTRLKEIQLSKITHRNQQQSNNHRTRRLSPIGESLSSANSETQNLNEISKVPIITQESCSTRKSTPSPLPPNNNNDNNLRVDCLDDFFVKRKDVNNKLQKQGSENINEGGMFHNRRGKFIVLGSSGELLPIKRKSESNGSVESSEDDEFHSAKTSLENGTLFRDIFLLFFSIDK